MLAYSLFFGHGCQNRLFRIQARDLVMHVSRHFSCSDNCRRSTSSRLKVACTAHYNTVIARVTKQMFTNVKTKKIINGLFYKSLNKKRLYNRNSVCQRVHAFLKSPWPMLLQISLRSICILLACFTFLKAVSVEERNFSRENSTLVYLYLKSSVHLFTTQFCLIYVTAPLFPGGFRKKTNS